MSPVARSPGVRREREGRLRSRHDSPSHVVPTRRPALRRRWRRAPGAGRERRQRAGFVVDAGKRWLVTCRHVVADRPAVDVYFPWHRDGRLVTDRADYLGNRPLFRERGLLVTGKVIRRDDAADLALVELESLPPDPAGCHVLHDPGPARRPAPRRRTPPRPRHPLERDHRPGPADRPARGRLRLAREEAGDERADAILGQLPIEEGDSGGPAVNARGELVGMAAALRRQAPAAAVIISATEIRKFLSR